MHRCYLAIVFALMITGCARQTEQPQEPAITLINTGALEAPLFDRIRAFAEKELQVRIRTGQNERLSRAEYFPALEKAAAEEKTDADVAYIVISGLSGEDGHLAVFETNGIAIVNVMPLATDDAEKYYRRVERQVMRAAAFVFGLPPTPDPFCVTRDYRSLEDLDRMGRNYSPPWQGRFAEEAARRGLTPLNVQGAVKNPAP